MSRRLRSVVSGPAPKPVSVFLPTLMPVPLLLDLVAAVIQGGAPPAAALRSVGAVLQATGDPRGLELESLAESQRIDRPDPLTVALEQTLELAARSGLPPTVLIHSAAARARRRRIAAQMKAVHRLEVLIVVPAGLCLLPAFVLLGVVPVVLDLLLG